MRKYNRYYNTMKNLINVFQDTLEISKRSPNTSITTKHTFDEVIKPTTHTGIQEAVAKANAVAEKIQFEGKYYRKDIGYEFKSPEYNGNISVVNLDTVSAITEYSKLGKVCAINMASYKRPGGGVERGARAQEECLFRCSNLFDVISKDFYPLNENECLYTERALFFKDKDYEWMETVECDIITSAALRLAGVVTDKGIVGYEPENEKVNYDWMTREKIRLMCSVPHTKGSNILILGAWGCGVFNNDPTKMANFFKDVLIGEGYSSLYDKVVFAVINDHNSVGNNFDIFNKILNEQIQQKEKTN